MPRPVTLFTGQWADLPFETICEKAKSFGYDGLELACWGDHFEVDRALEDDSYVQGRWDTLNKHGLQCFAISNHLVGQAVADRIDERHESILAPHIWGDGTEDGVRARAAEEMKNTARAAAKFGVKVVPGFTGSPIWNLVYSFPPNPPDFLEKGLALFAELWTPVLDVFSENGVKFGWKSTRLRLLSTFLAPKMQSTRLMAMRLSALTTTLVTLAIRGWITSASFANSPIGSSMYI